VICMLVNKGMGIDYDGGGGGEFYFLIGTFCR
jgi:hypothetical protein